jgi:hypothetical protein
LYWFWKRQPPEFNSLEKRTPPNPLAWTLSLYLLYLEYIEELKGNVQRTENKIDAVH